VGEPEHEVQVRIDLLGPLRLSVAGRPVDVPGPRRRAVLALLAMAGGRVVSTDELLDAVWPEEVPDSGRRALHSHISRLRGHLGPAGDRLARAGTGYRLALAPDELDVSEARRAAAGADGAAGDPATAAAALGLWRGAALGEFADVAPLAAEATALAELRRELTDGWLTARLAASTDAPDPQLVADATRAAADDPLRERTHALLVRVLAAAGRQADALRAAHDFRRRLADETGLDAGPDLAGAEQQAALGPLASTAGPGAPPGGGGPPARRSRPASPMVGREHELAELRRRMAAERLITLVGPGGVGKTRLALEAAADVADDGRTVTVVELAAVTDDRHVVPAVAAALGLRPRRDDEVVDAARDALAVGAPVLVLDNCEHVLTPVRDLATALVGACPALALLATSREPLGLASEHLVRLGPLAVPEEGTAGTGGVPAVEAFLAHARRRQPDLALGSRDATLVADIVRRLDGLPLALELAAGRIGTLSLVDLHARLDRALDLFEAGRPAADARHRTLRDTIAWSHRALPDDGVALLGAIAVFPGGVDLDTAEWLGPRVGVTTDPASVVAHLVDASMLVARRVPTPAGEATRYRPLETVRTFALDRLDATGGRAAADAALVAWAVRTAAAVDGLAAGPDEARADALIRSELANLRAAWDLAGAAGDIDARAALAIDLDDVTTYRDLPDVAGWAIELAGDPALAGHPRRAEVLGAAASSSWLQGRLDESARLADESVAAATTPAETARAAGAQAAATLFRGDPAVAADQWEAAAPLTPAGGAKFLPAAGLAAHYGGDDQRARDLLARGMAATEAQGAPSYWAFALYTAAEMASGTDPETAVDLYGRAITLARSVGATFVEGVSSVGLVRLWGATGHRRRALEGYRSLLASWRRSGHWTQVWTTLRNLATLLAAAGQHEAAVTLLAAADAAPEAPAVRVDVVAAELAALEDGLAESLGPDRVASLRTAAGAGGRGEVVDLALGAIDAALT